MLVYADEPYHRPQRRIVTGAFTPRRVTMIEDRIRELVAALIDGFLAEGRVEVVQAFANVIPGTVFAELLGVPAEEHAMFKQWADDIVSAFGGPPEAQARSVPVMARLAEYFLAVFAERRRVLVGGGTLPDDLITALMTSEFEGRYFDDTELILAIHIFMVAGLETTATAITNAVYLLAAHPEQRELLLRDASLIPNAVEEVLRYESPIQQLFRTTTSATEIAGCPIAADDKVSVQYGAANRDPRVFPDPDTFDVTRDPATLRKHLAFGFGIHTCLGAALARAELRIALEELLHRIGAWNLDPADPPVRGG
jgi:cytochrome P450